MKTGAKKGGAKKFGRNSAKCKRYVMANRRARSHIRRITKHRETYKDNSPMVVEALKKYRQLLTRGDLEEEEGAIIGKRQRRQRDVRV